MIDRTRLRAGQIIFYARGLEEGKLTPLKGYPVLDDEIQQDRWRIIRVKCDDGQARKVPPAAFTNGSGIALGCQKCWDTYILQGGEDQGAFIKRCSCVSNG